MLRSTTLAIMTVVVLVVSVCRAGAPKESGAADTQKRAPRNDKWQTVERLLLDAKTVKRAKTICVSDNGRRVGFEERNKDHKERMVIDGQPQKWYKNVYPISASRRRPWQLFLQDGKHYVYAAEVSDKEHVIVVDGKEGKKYGFIGRLDGYIDSVGGLWACRVYEKGELGRSKFLVNGEELYKLPGVLNRTVIVGRHSLYVDFDAAGKYYAVLDGKRGPAFGWIDKKTLLLHSTGAHAYVGNQKIGFGGQIVVNGKPSERIYKITLASFASCQTFSNDGKHHAIGATTMDGQDVVVVDGKDYPVPSLRISNG